MTTKCKAAIYNPANACTDRCKWPGACPGLPSKASEDLKAAEVAKAVEEPKKKASRAKKAVS